MSRALGLVAETFIPFELTHQLEQPLLTAARDELLERLGHCGFYTSFNTTTCDPGQCGRVRTGLMVVPEAASAAARLMSASG